MNQNLNLKQQLRCIYTSDFFSGLRITDAVWVALLAARGFSLWEIGLAESVYHIVSLFCEVPSGMAADLLGRRKTLLSGGVLTVTCNLLMAFAPNLFTICLAMGLNALAMTMFSGTFTALVYDSLKTEGREDEYIQVSANSSQISMLANAIGSLASLLKRFLGFAGFYLLSAAFEGVSTAALALMEEPIVTKAQASRGRQTLRALPGQFTKLARNSLSILRTTPLAAKLIVSSAVVSVPSYLTKMFLQQRLIELGWPTELLFLPLLLGGAACVLGAEVGRVVVYHISVFLEMTFPSTLAVSYNHCNPPLLTIPFLSKQSQLPAFTPFPSIHIPMDSVFDSILNSRGEEERKREEAVPEEENSPKRTRVDEEWIVCGTA